MGNKIASLHFRTDNPQSILDDLIEKYSSKSKSRAKKDEYQFFSQLVTAIVSNDLEKTEKDESQREEKLNELNKELAEMSEEYEQYECMKNGLLIIQNGFISLYDRSVRTDNIEKLAIKYSKKYNLPIMGLSVYDDSNFIVFATVNGEQKAKGFYWFDEDDVAPLNVNEFLNVMRLDYDAGKFSSIFDCDSGEEMAERFRQFTDIPVFLFYNECYDASEFRHIQSLPGISVYQKIS